MLIDDTYKPKDKNDPGLPIGGIHSARFSANRVRVLLKLVLSVWLAPARLRNGDMFQQAQNGSLCVQAGRAVLQMIQYVGAGQSYYLINLRSIHFPPAAFHTRIRPRAASAAGEMSRSCVGRLRCKNENLSELESCSSILRRTSPR